VSACGAIILLKQLNRALRFTQHRLRDVIIYGSSGKTVLHYRDIFFVSKISFIILFIIVIKKLRLRDAPLYHGLRLSLRLRLRNLDIKILNSYNMISTQKPDEPYLFHVLCPVACVLCHHNEKIRNRGRAKCQS